MGQQDVQLLTYTHTPTIHYVHRTAIDRNRTVRGTQAGPHSRKVNVQVLLDPFFFD